MGIYTYIDAEAVGSRLNAASQDGVPEGHFRTQTGAVINLRSAEEVMAESERLFGWSRRWLKLANDRTRMCKMGALQSQQDYIIGRSVRAERAREIMLRTLWAIQKRDAQKAAAEIGAASAEEEVLAWRSRFPQYAYRPQDGCVAPR